MSRPAPAEHRPLPQVDLGREYAAIADAARATFSRLADAGEFVLGADLEAFEQEFAAYCGARHCVGVASGTDALQLALEALGARPGKEVVTVPHTFIATVEAIAATGARPVLADVDPATAVMDPTRLRGAIGSATVAVVPVHLYGRPAPMPALREACGGLPLLEDAAQAHGAELDGVRTGALGTAAAFSFYPTKNLGAFGDAGAVVCADDHLAATVRSLRHHGSAPGDPNRHDRRGRTARLDNLQAALLRLKLPGLDNANDERRRAAALYREALAGLPLELPPADPQDGRHVYHLFVVRSPRRDELRAALQAQGIGAGVHYPTPVHLQPAWRELGGGEGSFPGAEEWARTCLSLPLFPGITESEVARVATALREALG